MALAALNYSQRIIGISYLCLVHIEFVIGWQVHLEDNGGITLISNMLTTNGAILDMEVNLV